MKKKLILMCVAGVLVMTAIIGGTLAGFNTATENKGVTNITVKALGIEMLGTDNGNLEQANAGKAKPGGEMELVKNIQNNVEGGYTLYTRVTIDKKWSDETLDASKIHLYVGSGDNKVELTAGTTVNDWIVWYVDAEQVVLYYTKPLEQGQSSTNFVETLSFDADMDNAYAGKEALIDFSADAVQTIAAEDSIPSEWGVYPVFNEDGTIAAIEE